MKFTRVRIVERTYPNKWVRFVIQVRSMPFFWRWVDGSKRKPGEKDTFITGEDALRGVCNFDGTKQVDRVIHEV